MKHIQKYLKRTKDMLLIYGGSDIHMDGYTDSDFQSNVDDCKLTSDFVFLLNGGAMS